MNTVSNVGKVILSNDKKMRGLVTHETQRYCAVCKKTHKCYIVRWDNGACTKPCEKAIEVLNDDELIIK